jgi:Flp pilus assembly protein TadG
MTYWKRPHSAGWSRRGSRWLRRALARRQRAGMAVFVAVALPALVLLGGLAVDQAVVSYRYSLLNRTAESGALAAQTYLSSYYAAGGTYSSTSMATMNSVVATAVTSAMPTASYGTVVPTTTSNTTSNIQLGTWNPTAGTFTVTSTTPNAVKVTALNTSANGNPVHTMFGSLVNKPTVDMSASAIASFGSGLSGAGGFNTIILNDLSMSFSSEIPDQRAADVAILNCISSGTNGNGSVGLTSFDGDPKMLNAAGASGFPTQTAYSARPYTAYSTTSYSGTLVKATSTNVTAMTTFINGTLNYCGNSNMPPCSGSNVAAGLYSAIQQLSAASIANNSSNIILITDGIPNADSRTYSTSDGTGITPSSTINSRYSWAGCTTNCSDTDLWNAAQAWAAYAGSLGINVSTVFYSGDSGSNASGYAANLATLVKNQGIALVAPSSTSIDNAFATFCSTMGSAVKLLN